MKTAAQTATSGKLGPFATGPRAFRPQLGARKSPTARDGKSLLKSVAILVSRGGGRRAGYSSQSDRGGGRSGTGKHPAWKFSQRVVIKARVVRNRGAGGRGTVRDHVNYVERDGVDEEGGKGRSFGIDDYLTESEVDAFVERTADDRHHFRFIVSPEHAGELDLQTYTQELMLQAELDLGTQLDWIAVEHHNTDNPHVHVIVRGVDDRGADLVIGRDYISRGFRERAQEIATRYLGPRRESELDKERAEELRAGRATSLDRTLAADALEGKGVIDVRPPRDPEPGFRERIRVEKITRLHHLESLGLANEIQSGRWEIDPEAVEKLQTMARRAALLADLTRQAGDRFQFRDVAVYDKTAPDAERIQGEVVGRAKVDELAERDYVFIASNSGVTAGKVYRVALSAFSERPEAPIRRGQVVDLSVYERPAVTPSDANIIKQAAKDGGLYSEERHYQWTKALNQNRDNPIDDVEGFIERHIKRIEGHERRGFVEKVQPGVWRVPPDLKEKLEDFARTERDRGSFPLVTPVSTLTLDEQVKATGPTWLDQKLAKGEHLAPDPSPEALSAERRLRASLLRRVEELEGRGINVAQRALVAQDIETLYKAEVAKTAERLAPEFGKYVELEAIQPTGVDRRRRIEGKLERIENLASGPHAVVVNSKGFAVLPASQRTAEHLGKQMSVVLRDVEAKDPSRPNAMQMRVRYAELERQRERDLGRNR